MKNSGYHTEAEVREDKLRKDTGRTTSSHTAVQRGGSHCPKHSWKRRFAQQARGAHQMYCNRSNGSAGKVLLFIIITYFRNASRDRG